MIKLPPILCLTFSVLLLTATEGIALPACPEYQDEHYHNCYGIYTTADGSEYVGKFSNGKKRKYKKYANYNNEKTHTREYNWFGRNHYP